MSTHKNFTTRAELLNLIRELHYHNTRLRLENIQLAANLDRQLETTQRWIDLCQQAQRVAANWETTALAAIAKAQALEGQ